MSCDFELNRNSESFRAEGGEAQVEVRSASDCGWTAASGVSWIVIESGRSGSGNGQVRYRVAANPQPERRSATLTIAERAFRVEQEGAKQPDQPPDKPEKVDVDGSVGALRGGCPTLEFKVRGEDVVTDGNTKFKGGSCADIRNGQKVSVKGERRGSGPIRAEAVDIDR